MKIGVPEFALVLLVGPAGSGKSTFAHAHFKPGEVISSDFCRSLVGEGEDDQAATPAAFELLHTVVRLRLRGRRLAVVDAVSARSVDRRPLLALAREHDCAAVAIVFGLPEELCVERDRQRPARSVGPRAIHRQREDLVASLPGLREEGFEQVHLLPSAAAVDEIDGVKRVPLPVNRRWERGPFDVIGDVHGCLAELRELLHQLGYLPTAAAAGGGLALAHPESRKALFVGDLVDGGPDTPGVLRLAIAMANAGSALCVRGDHEDRLLQALSGRPVEDAPGLELSLRQLEGEPALWPSAAEFLQALPSHLVLDRGALVVTHAGIKSWMQGRDSPRVRRFALDAETSGEVDDLRLPVRLDWARDYRGRARVVYGHSSVSEVRWEHRTINVDTGCVFGGRLTALRYPELDLVSVAAAAAYAPRPRPGISSSILRSDSPVAMLDDNVAVARSWNAMAQTVREVMTAKPLALQAGTTLTEAAKAMRDHDVGTIVLLRDDEITGIVTDRDITVRAVAEGMDPNQTVLAQVSSQELTTISPSTSLNEAVELMRSHAVRRLPVVEDGRPIGIVSIGDLAVERDSGSALADISSAEPNR